MTATFCFVCLHSGFTWCVWKNVALKLEMRKWPSTAAAATACACCHARRSRTGLARCIVHENCRDWYTTPQSVRGQRPSRALLIVTSATATWPCSGSPRLSWYMLSAKHSSSRMFVSKSLTGAGNNPGRTWAGNHRHRHRSRLCSLFIFLFPYMLNQL